MNLRYECGALAVILVLAAAISPAWSEDSSWPDLSSPPKAMGGGEKDAAVIVGAEKYVFVESVPGAKENADAWQAYLTETLRIPAEKVALLRDDDATNDEIRQAAVEKAAQVEPGGTLWFVFIGHGAPSKDGKDGLLVGVDAQQKAESVYKRSLSRNELLTILAKGKQERTVVLIDACFSGKAPSGRDLVANLQPLVTMRNLPQGIDNRTILLTAARSDQFAGPLPKTGKPRPAFSYLALGALRGWAADASGRVTARGIVDYARKALSLAHDRTQTPELAAGAPGTVLGRGREKAPDLAKIDREATSSGSGAFAASNIPAVPAVEARKKLKHLIYEEVTHGKQFSPAQRDDMNIYLMSGVWAHGPDGKIAKNGNGDILFEFLNKSGLKKTAAVSSDALTKGPQADAALAKAAVDVIAVFFRGDGRKASAPTAGKAGIQWVSIPGGAFTMGSADPDLPLAKPTHQVTVKSFQMAKTLVTNKQYKACVDAGACTAPNDCGENFKGDDQPVVCVDWKQAETFSEWAGGRLPSEAEWEYAARSGGKNQKYPWGDEAATCERAIINDGGFGCGKNSTWPVCSKPAGNTQQGLCDMAGNVWEWVQDWWHESYEGAPTDGGAWEDEGSKRLFRGGAWSWDSGRARSAYRYIELPGSRYNNLGFRPAR